MPHQPLNTFGEQIDVRESLEDKRKRLALAPPIEGNLHGLTGAEILAQKSPLENFIKAATLGLAGAAGTAGLLGLPGTNAAAGGGIGGSGSIIGGQFVPAGGFVSDAALAGLPQVGGAAGTVSSGLGGGGGFLGGGGLSTAGTSAAALNADILAGGSGSIGGGAVGSSIPGAGEGAFGLTQDFAGGAGSSLLDKIQQGAGILDTINSLGGREIGVSPGAPGSTGGGGGNPLLFPGKVRDVGTGATLESLIGRPEDRGQELAPQVRAEEMGVFDKFFGNLDQNLESPSKLLGLGLLSRADPRLAQAGLVAGGLFGQNKLF